MQTGDDILAWLQTDDARRTALAALRRYRTLARQQHELVDDVLNDAALNVLERMQHTLEVESAPAYGNTVIANVVNNLVRGRPGESHADVELGPDTDVEDVIVLMDPTGGDDVRAVIEQRGDHRHWLTSATLTYLTISMFPDARPAHAPWPEAGARPDQARCWPAIWLSGRRDVFPDARDDVRERNRKAQARARLIRQVLEHFASASAQWTIDTRGTHG